MARSPSSMCATHSSDHHGVVGTGRLRVPDGRAPSAISHPSPTGHASAAAAPASLALSPADAAAGVNPTTPVTATATGGRLTAVSLINTATKLVVHGRLASRGTRWTTTQVLGYGKHYQLTATAVDAAGARITRTARFTTLAPRAQATVDFNTVYGNAMVTGATYGVGMIPVVTFDTPVTDRAAAERGLRVTTSPHVDGGWNWLDSTHVHWRPRHFYQPGTRVRIDARIYGARLGTGLYGASDESTSFVVGARHVSIADDTTHQVQVYFGSTLMRTMPTSMGEHTGEWVGGHYISFWTMDGTYTVIGHENPAIMSSASYGLPADAQGGYAPEKMYWSTKISTDGIYLHELDGTVDHQGHDDVSHGCLNLNHDNAEWFYEHSYVGDVVIVKHNGGPKITLAQGGDWSVPWSAWLRGSALS